MTGARCDVPSKWDNRFFAMAELVATWSKDPNKQVGAVLVSPDCRHVAFGYNGFPAGADDELFGMMDRDTKNRYTLHAEANAIANAATDVRGWTLYVTEAPCLPCALVISRAGIARLVTAPLKENSNWYGEQKDAEGFLADMEVMQERCVA